MLKQPLTVVEKIVNTTLLADGTKVTQRTEERRWRDSQERFRKEVTCVADGQEPVFQVSTIIDSAKNAITTLHMDAKTASMVHLEPGQLLPYVDLDDKQLIAMPGVHVKVEKLDGRSIAGVYAVGRRVTRTRPPGQIGNDKTIVSVSERWMSPDLQVLLASSMDDLRKQQMREVTQLERTEPEASLFQIPADYTVKEAEGRPLR